MKWLFVELYNSRHVDQQLFRPYLLISFQGSRTLQQSVQRRFYVMA